MPSDNSKNLMVSFIHRDLGRLNSGTTNIITFADLGINMSKVKFAVPVLTSTKDCTVIWHRYEGGSRLIVYPSATTNINISVLIVHE